MAQVSLRMREIISRIMGYLFFMFLVLILSLMKSCRGTSVKENCRFPLLSNHDEVMNDITAETIDLATSVVPNLYEGWCRRDEKGSYVQVDLKIELSVTGMVIRGHSGRWVKHFWFQYSKDGSSWFYYNEDGGNSPMALAGNTDAESNNLFWFKFTVDAQYIRVIPTPYAGGSHGGGGKPCFRFELFGCRNDLRNSLGLSEGRIGATLLITSGHARQKFKWNITTIYKGVDSAKGWCPLMSTGSRKEQLIILLEGIHEVSGFAMMKCSNLPCVPVNATFVMRTWSKREIEEKPDQQALGKDGKAQFSLQGAMVGARSNSLLYIFKKPVSGTIIFMDFYPGDCGVVDCSFCLRMELYGNQLECLSALGVESSYLHPHGAVKDKQMTASSSHDDHPAQFGRREHESAWCASPVALKDPVIARSQYLQIDFIKRKNITAISTQGLNANNYVKAYYLYHAMNDVDFHSLRDEERNTRKLFETCPEFGKRLQFNFLSKPILARYLRINPQRWLNDMCLGVEVFGCDTGASSVGMEFGMIPHQQIKASSEILNNTKDFGRLNNAGWCAVVEPVTVGKVQYHYFQVDLLKPHYVCSVASQGIRTSDTEKKPEGVTSYYLKYSLTGVEWLRYHKLLAGEYSGNTLVQHWLEPQLVTRFIEFNPQTSQSPSKVCMRVEIYTCENDGLEKYLPIGMESFQISNVQLSASSEMNMSYSATHARLNLNFDGGAWVPAKSDPTEYLQIDLTWITILSGIMTQGHPENSHRLLSYTLQYGISSEDFTMYNKEFEANTVEGSSMFKSINSTICRFVKIYPLSWSGKVALRVELYGYEAGFCHDRLGVLSSLGPSLLNASSFASYSLPDYGHLHSGLGTGAWCAEKQDTNQYLQVNLAGDLIITGVATQGQKHSDGWVSSFKVAYSVNYQLWDDYPVDGRSTTFFTGNKDHNTAVLHLFSSPIMARYVRFHPQTWSVKICMRVEIYGCAGNTSSCVGCSQHASCLHDNRGTETCICKPGYSGIGTSCQDRDECQGRNKPCPDDRDCQNTIGSYTCSCKTGFLKNGSHCADIDECEDSQRCPSSTTCVNTPGSFKCDCGQGFLFHAISRTCKDIDECSVDDYDCSPLAECVNSIGSYSCACRKGYTGHGKWSCVDVNECNQISQPCPENSLCENSEGSYFCLCQAGFVMQDGRCQDVDECQSGMCQVHADCVNNIGSYECHCRSGFISNGPHCIDFNECLSSRHDCDANALCANIAGSYRCFCKEGYVGDGFQCKKEGE